MMMMMMMMTTLLLGPVEIDRYDATHLGFSGSDILNCVVVSGSQTNSWLP